MSHLLQLGQLASAAASALARRRPQPPLPYPPSVSRGLLVQHVHCCRVHGEQIVSVLEPGCACSPGGPS